MKINNILIKHMLNARPSNQPT